MINLNLTWINGDRIQFLNFPSIETLFNKFIDSSYSIDNKMDQNFLEYPKWTISENKINLYDVDGKYSDNLINKLLANRLTMSDLEDLIINKL